MAAIRNPQKGEPLFTLDERQEMLVESLAHLDNVGSTPSGPAGRLRPRHRRRTPSSRACGRVVRLRLRAADGADEPALSGVDTLFMPTAPEHSFLSSSLVREVARFGGDVSSMVPAPVGERLKERYARDRREPHRGAAQHMEAASEHRSDALTPCAVRAIERRDERSERPATSPTPRSCCAGSLDIVNGAPDDAAVVTVRVEQATRCVELLEEAVDRLPDELRQARWLLKEREEFLAKVQREADEILEAARARAERMVQRTELVREAQRLARRTIEEADAEARELRHEAEDYCDQKLATFEIVLERTMKTVRGGPGEAPGRRRSTQPRLEGGQTLDDLERRQRRSLLRPGRR